MVEIVDEIVDTLNKHTFSIPVKDVKRDYSVKQVVYPMIVVYELGNTTYLQLHGVEKLSTISFQFDIYAKDMRVEKDIIPARRAVSIIREELDEVIRSVFGLKRDDITPIVPYDVDKNTFRCVVRYSGQIDNKTQIIYQV